MSVWPLSLILGMCPAGDDVTSQVFGRGSEPTANKQMFYGSGHNLYIVKQGNGIVL